LSRTRTSGSPFFLLEIAMNSTPHPRNALDRLFRAAPAAYPSAPSDDPAASIAAPVKPEFPPMREIREGGSLDRIDYIAMALVAIGGVQMIAAYWLMPSPISTPLIVGTTLSWAASFGLAAVRRP
jgi:hypothetical protein